MMVMQSNDFFNYSKAQIALACAIVAGSLIEPDQIAEKFRSLLWQENERSVFGETGTERMK
jgi:hypothetical protein